MTATLIYFATDQWFIEIDNSGIRNKVIAEAKMDCNNLVFCITILLVSQVRV